MNQIIKQENINIEDLIYEIRGKQVILDSDLARLYKCTNGTKDINKAVKRNIDRFPDDFYFQITDEEYAELSRFQFGTLNKSGNNRGFNLKYLPYAFTEEGVAMLSSLLHTEIAKKVSVDIMRAFVKMRKFISNNLFEIKSLYDMLINHDNKINYIDNEVKQLQEAFDKLEEKELKNKLIFDGKIYDTYSKIIDILNKANKEIIIIDNYADKTVLDIISKINKDVTLITRKNNLLKQIDIDKYNKQYHNLKIIYDNSFHDRFIILDKDKLYHLGSSINYIGNKITTINIIEEDVFKNSLYNKLKTIL